MPTALRNLVCIILSTSTLSAMSLFVFVTAVESRSDKNIIFAYKASVFNEKAFNMVSNDCGWTRIEQPAISGELPSNSTIASIKYAFQGDLFYTKVVLLVICLFNVLCIALLFRRTK